MGGVVDVVKACAEPISKFIDAVSRGIGCAYEPRKVRRLADSKAYEISTIADAIRKNDDLPICFEKDGVQIDASDYRALAERANNRLMFQEMRKQQNIESIVEKAYKEVETFTEVSSDPVGDDWIVRFFNSVEDVSDEKLQEIWGKILAGEIKKPRSSSLRTLDILKNLSVSEAVLFDKVSSCFLRSGPSVFVPNTTDLWTQQNIKYRDLIALSDAGIINLSLVDITLYINSDKNIIYNNSIMGVLLSSSENSPNSIVIDTYFLTEAGKDLSQVSSCDLTKCREFSLAYFRKLKNGNKDVSVSAYDVISIDGDNIRHSLLDLLA